MRAAGGALIAVLTVVVAGVAAEELQELVSFQLTSTALAFSPDGSLLAVAAGDEIQLWETDDWTELRTLQGHEGTVTGVAFDGGGVRLASSSWDETVWIWDVESGQQAQTIGGYNSWVRAVDLSPDGALVASGALEHRLGWGLLLLSDVRTGRARMTKLEHEDWVRAVAFSPDGKLLASGSDDRTVRVWDVSTRSGLVALSGLRGRVHAVAFSGDGKRLLAGTWGGVTVWNCDDWSQVGAVSTHRRNVRSLAASPGSELVASGDDDGTLVVWSSVTLDVQWTTGAHEGAVRALAFHPHEELLVSCGEDGLMKIWILPGQAGG